MPKACMESATCSGMESRRRSEWNHHKVMYGINPKKKCTLVRDTIPPHSGEFHAPHIARWCHANPSDWIKKERSNCFVLFLVHLQGFEPGTHWLRVSCSTNWAKGALLTSENDYITRLRKMQVLFWNRSIFAIYFLKTRAQEWVMSLTEILYFDQSASIAFD